MLKRVLLRGWGSNVEKPDMGLIIHACIHWIFAQLWVTEECNWMPRLFNKLYQNCLNSKFRSVRAQSNRNFHLGLGKLCSVCQNRLPRIESFNHQVWPYKKQLRICRFKCSVLTMDDCCQLRYEKQKNSLNSLTLESWGKFIISLTLEGGWTVLSFEI